MAEWEETIDGDEPRETRGSRSRTEGCGGERGGGMGVKERTCGEERGLLRRLRSR